MRNAVSARTLLAALVSLGGVIAMIVGLEIPVVRGLTQDLPSRTVGMRVFMWEGNHPLLSVALTIGVVTTLFVTLAALRSVRFRWWAVLSALVTLALGTLAFFFLKYDVSGGVHATYQEFVDVTAAVFSGASEGLSKPVFFAGAVATLVGLPLIKGPARWVKADGDTNGDAEGDADGAADGKA